MARINCHPVSGGIHIISLRYEPNAPCVAWPNSVILSCAIWLPRQITLVRCRGAKSLVYDLITDQGVVSSRAVSLHCDLLRLSLDWALCFCPSRFSSCCPPANLSSPLLSSPQLSLLYLSVRTFLHVVLLLELFTYLNFNFLLPFSSCCPPHR